MDAGTQVSHYRIIRKLGAGGMGEVYEAEDLHLKRTVALKFLLPHSLGDENARKRFWREAQYAASFQDPHIATVYEIGETDGQIFIAMEYIEGQTLRSRIREKPLTANETIRLCVQILRALEKAHQRRIIHRDIKSANILIDIDGEVKILDFGLAKALHGPRPPGQTGEEGVTIESLTAEQAVVGTIEYMSPEILRGVEADEGSDLYAVGIVLYEMVTGKLPYGGATFAEKIAAKLNQSAALVEDPNIPPLFRSVIAKALNPISEKRYANAGEMLADIQSVTQVEPTQEATVVELLRPSLVEAAIKVLPAAPRMSVSLLALMVLTLPSVFFAESLSQWRITSGLLGALAGITVLPAAVAAGVLVFKGRVPILQRIAGAWDHRLWMIAALAVIAVIAGAMRVLDLAGFGWLGDWRFAIRTEEPSREIVLIDLDDASRRKFLDIEATKVNSLPYWRRFHGQLLRQIILHGPPKAIAFDLYFSDPSEFDQDFAGALKMARQQKVPVVLGERFYPAERQFSVTIDPIKQAVAGPDGEPAIGQNFALFDALRPGPEEPVRRLALVIREYTTRPDEGVAEVRVHPSFVLMTLTGGVFDKRWLIPGERISTPEESIQLDPPYVGQRRLGQFEFETLSINFPTESFDRISYFEVYSGNTPESFFRNRYVIIGSAYEEFEPPAHIPNSLVYPFQIHASALSTLRRRSYIRHASPSAQALAVLMSCYLIYAVGLGVHKKTRWLKLAMVTAVLISALFVVGSSLLLYRLALFWLDSGYAILASATIASYILVSHRKPQTGG